jgi:HlyD family secretion protein
LKTKKLLVWLGFGLAVVGAGAYGVVRFEKARATPDVQLKTQAAAKTKIVGKVTATGTLSAVVTVQVGSQVSGRISELLVDFNSPVKKGQLIAKLDPQLFQAAVEQSQANFLSARANEVKAQAQIVEADRQFERQKALHAQGLSTKADLDAAETNAAVARSQVDVAKSSIEQSRASLNQAKVNLSYATIVSPIDGVVISRNVDVGQTVAASLQAPVLFTIAEDLRKMQVITKVAEGDVGRLQPQMSAYFTVDAFPGQRFKGVIEQIRNAATTVQNVVTYDAVIVVENKDLKLRPGMTANVTVIYAERDDALAVPNAALRYRPPASLASSASASPTSGPGVGAGQGRGGRKPPEDLTKTIWVVRSGAPEQLTIKTGLTDGTVTEVVDGDLKPGDAVVIESTGGESGGSRPASSAPGSTGGPNPFRRIF